MKKVICLMFLVGCLLLIMGCAQQEISEDTAQQAVNADVLKDKDFLECAETTFQNIGIEISAENLTITKESRNPKYDYLSIRAEILYDGITMEYSCLYAEGQWRGISISDAENGKCYWMSDTAADLENVYDWKTGNLISEGTSHSSESSSSEIAESLPEVTYSEIQTGKYGGQTVTATCAVSDVDFDSVLNSVSFDCWILDQASYVFDPLWSVDLDEEELSVLKDAKEGEVYKFTVELYDDSSFGGSSLKKAEKLEETVDISGLEQQYKDACASYSCEDLLRNPDEFEGEKVKFSGEVFQIISDDSSTIEFLLDTGEENGIVYAQYLFSDGESRILEGDKLTIYAPFYMLESYTSILGTQRTVPKLYAYFIDNEN